MTTAPVSVAAMAAALLGLADAWLFTSMAPGNAGNRNQNKILDIWTADEEEGAFPIPYEPGEPLEIDEENPPPPPNERISMSFPGTKWCGPGNTAYNYHDLGEKNETDKCCRAHDYCDDIIPAGHTAHGLVNDDFYSKLNCKCDEKFYDCLHKSTDDIAETIGKLYFNAIGTKCFRLDYPIVKCLVYRGIIRKKCLEYEFDTSGEKKYQWFDVPPYK